MSDLVELYLVFALIYTLECAEIVPRRAFGLIPFAGRWRLRRTFMPNTAWARGLLFADPWPPLEPALVTEDVPLTLGPDGLGHGARAAEGQGGFVPWGEVATVAAVGTQLQVNGEMVARLATRRGALALVALCTEVGRLPAAARAQRLRGWLDARFDAKAVTARVPVFRRETRALRIATNVLWVGLFVGLPALLFTSLIELLLPIAVVTLAAWVAAAILFERALRKSSWLGRELRPELSKRIVAITSPLATLRSTDHLARELCGDLDPLAVAAPLLSPERLSAFARPRLRDLKYRVDVPAPGGEADLAWWRGELLRRFEVILRARKLDPEAMLAAPERDDPEVVSWCPRCLAQYRASTPPRTACENETCRGIAPQSFSGESMTASEVPR